VETVTVGPGVTLEPLHAVYAGAGRQVRTGSHSPGFATPDWVNLAASMVQATAPFADSSGGLQALYGVGHSTAGLSRRYRLELGPGKIRVGSSVIGSEDGKTRGGRRGAITHWSRQSRLSMVEAMCSLDWSPVVAPGGDRRGWRPAMLTLTMPGQHWERYAPTGAAFKRILERFWSRWARRWGRVQCVWKLEFQDRGAPHVHIYAAIPAGRHFREWLSRTWWECVGSGQLSHLRAGTGVDWREGITASDPKRLAVYFLKRATGHNLGLDKEYQHVVPAAWQSAACPRGVRCADCDAAHPIGSGRFWGVKGLAKASIEVQLDQAQFVGLRRILRRWAKANGRPVRSLHGGVGKGGMVLANDAPALLSQAVRAMPPRAAAARADRHHGYVPTKEPPLSFTGLAGTVMGHLARGGVAAL
jgi:hypothetical protein